MSYEYRAQGLEDANHVQELLMRSVNGHGSVGSKADVAHVMEQKPEARSDLLVPLTRLGQRDGRVVAGNAPGIDVMPVRRLDHSELGGSRRWSQRAAAPMPTQSANQNSGSQMPSINVAREEVTARPALVSGLGRCSFYGVARVPVRLGNLMALTEPHLDARPLLPFRALRPRPMLEPWWRSVGPIRAG
jgi:hypothetical protein